MLALESRHKNNFHLIRLLAACQVIINHVSFWLHVPVNPYFAYFIELFPGVAVFFIVSGYLVTQSFIEAEGKLKTYAISRILRIYPGLWLNLMIIITLLYGSHAFNGQDIITYPFLSRVLLLFMAGNDCPSFLCGAYPFSFTGFFKHFPSGVLWTISVELGFYVCVPILFGSFLAKKQLKFAFIFGGSMMISFMMAVLHTHFILTKSTGFLRQFLDNTVFGYLWIFLMGALINLYWKRFSPMLVNKWYIWLSAYVLLSLAALIMHHDHILEFKVISVFNIVRILALALFIISFAYSLNVLNLFPGKIDISYGLYLYHMQIVYTLLFVGFTRSPLLWPIVFIFTVIAALCSWFLIERPCLRFKNYYKFRSQSQTRSELIQSA